MITLCLAQHHHLVVDNYEKTKMRKSGGYDKMSGSALLAVILLVSSYVTEVDCMELCVPTTGTVNNSTHKVPEISGSYVTFMEWWELDSTSVTYREEYVDDEMNIAAFRIYGLYDPGDVYTYISDYNSGQLFTIAETAEGLCSRCKKTCTASSVDSKGANTFAFTKINNTDHIAKTPFLLSFGKSLGEQYVGEGAMVRGKSAVIWKSCQTDTATNVTTQVMFYVTDEGWTSATTSSPVPVMSDMTKLIPGIPPEPDIEIATRIDFVFFQNYITDRSIFQTHVDIFCEGRKETKPVPVIPNHFRFRAERIITHLNEVGAYDEWYNEDSKVIRIDSKPMPGNMAILDLSTRTEILDFNMGISFLIMQDTGYCTVTPIMPEEFNAKLTDPNHVALKSPEEFFHFDSGNFTYSGRTTVREIETDVWIGKRTDFPLGETSTSIWKWYFSTDEWSVSQFGEPLKNVPVLLKIDLPDKDLHYLYNIYDFTPQDPDLVHFDVSACYQQAQYRNLQFSIIGNPDIATKLPKLFNYQLSLRLTEIMYVSLLRISQLQSEFYDRGAFVTFTLLDPPEFKGDVAGTVDPSALLSSEKAVQNLDSFLNQGTILLHFHANNVNANNVSSLFVSVPSSLVDVVRFLDGSVEKLSDQSTTSAINHDSQNVTTSSIKSSSQVSSSSTTTSSTVTSNKQLSTAPTAVTKGELPASPTRKTLQPATSSRADDTSTIKCSIDNQKSEQTQEGIWTTSSVAGLAVGVTFFGVILGMVLMMVVRRLFFTKQPNNGMEEATGLNYMKM